MRSNFGFRLQNFVVQQKSIQNTTANCVQQLWFSAPSFQLPNFVLQMASDFAFRLQKFFTPQMWRPIFSAPNFQLPKMEPNILGSKFSAPKNGAQYFSAPNV